MELQRRGTYTRTHAGTNTRTHTHTHARMHARTHAHTHTHAHTYARKHSVGRQAQVDLKGFCDNWLVWFFLVMLVLLVLFGPFRVFRVLLWFFWYIWVCWSEKNIGFCVILDYWSNMTPSDFQAHHLTEFRSCSNSWIPNSFDTFCRHVLKDSAYGWNNQPIGA